MPTHAKTKLLLATAFATLGLLAFGAASIASGIITPNPGLEPPGPNGMFIYAMTLLPMSAMTFTEVSPENIQAPDARPFAVFNAATAKTAQTVAADFTGEYDPAELSVEGPPSDIEPFPGDERTNGSLYFAVLATLKYTLPDGVVLLTTTQPSAALLKYQIYMGNQELLLTNGLTAWGGVHESNTKPTFSNRLLWTQGNLILTLASDDLPLERLQELAVEVAMK